MDDILAKNLANIFLSKREDLVISEETSDICIPFHSYKQVKNSIFVRTAKDTFHSEIVGTWQNKPVINYNDSKYIVLENSKTIVNLKTYGIDEAVIEKFIESEEIENLLDSVNLLESNNINNSEEVRTLTQKDESITLDFLNNLKNIITSNPIDVNGKEKFLLDKKEEHIKEEFLNNLNNIFKNVSILPSEKSSVKPKVVKSKKTKEPIENKEEVKEIPPKNEELGVELPPVVSEVPVEVKPKTTTDVNVDSYLPKEPVNPEAETAIPDSFDKKEGIDTAKAVEDLFFELLEGKKTDKRFTRFFNNQIESVKKELFSITEQYTREIKMLAEGGGGTNAVQYANGGTMNGNLTVTGDLTVSGTINGSTSGGSGGSGGFGMKSTTLIGDGVNSEYTVTHNLNTKDLFIQVYDSNDELIFCSVKSLNTTQCKISFTSPISVNYARVVIFAYNPKQTFVVGDSVNDTFILTHSLGTKDILVTAYDNTTDELVLCSIKNLDNNETQVSFGYIPSNNSVRVVVVG